MTAIVPTVGRKLYFYPNGDTSVHRIDDQPVDATIIYVWPNVAGSSHLLNLSITDHVGVSQVKTSVLLVQDGDAAPEAGGYAQWMPFQVGQAKALQEPPPVPQTQGLALEMAAQIQQLDTQQQGINYSSDFAGALSALKAGKSIARAGWNGKGMFAYMVPANSYPAQTGAAKAFFGEGAMVPYNAYFALKGVDGTVNTWVPSISDLLASDWEVLG